MLNRALFNVALVKSGMTNRELSKKIGISKNTLSSRVNGKSPFNADEIDAICEELKITDDLEKAQIFLSRPSQNRDLTRNI